MSCSWGWFHLHDCRQLFSIYCCIQQGNRLSRWICKGESFIDKRRHVPRAGEAFLSLQVLLRHWQSATAYIQSQSQCSMPHNHSQHRMQEVKIPWTPQGTTFCIIFKNKNPLPHFERDLAEGTCQPCLSLFIPKSPSKPISCSVTEHSFPNKEAQKDLQCCIKGNTSQRFPQNVPLQWMLRGTSKASEPLGRWGGQLTRAQVCLETLSHKNASKVFFYLFA